MYPCIFVCCCICMYVSYMHMCVYIFCVAIRMHTLWYTNICMNISVFILRIALYIRRLYAYIYICMYVCILVYTYVMWPYTLLYSCCVFPVVVGVIVNLRNLAQVSDARNTPNLLTTNQINIGVHTYYSDKYRSVVAYVLRYTTYIHT